MFWFTLVLALGSWLPVLNAGPWEIGSYDEAEDKFRTVATDNSAKRLPSNVTHLVIGSEVRDFSFLNSADNLVALRVERLPQELANALANFPQLLSLEIEYANSAELAKWPVAKNLRTLVLSNETLDKEFSVVPNKFPSLQRLSLRAKVISREFLSSLESLSSLTALQIRKLSVFTDEELVLCSLLPQLLELRLTTISREGAKLSASAVKKIFELSSLQTLELRLATSFPLGEVESLPEELASLSIGANQTTPEWTTECAVLVAKLKNLEFLLLHAEALDELSLALISKNLPRLKTLTFLGDWPENAGTCLRRMKALRALTAGAGTSNNGLSVEAIEGIASQLVKLELYGFDLTSTWILSLNKARELRQLLLGGITMKKEDLDATCEVFSRLTQLTLFNCSQFYLDKYAAIRAATRVTQLQLVHQESSFSGEYAKAVAALPELKRLEIQCSAIGEVAIDALATAKKLQSVSVSYQSAVVPPSMFLRLKSSLSLVRVDVAPATGWTREEALALQEALPGTAVTVDYIR